MDLKKEFIADDKREYRFVLGRRVATALSGFIAGVIFTSIVWALTMYYYSTLYAGK